MKSPMVNTSYRLEDRFESERDRLYLTGWEALVRLPLMQRARDAAAGLSTAGFVSGYPGSPLGGLDSLLHAERERLLARHVRFEPGLNEDLAATSVWGTQYLNNGPVSSDYDGVFGMWYGKGPGLERSTDAMRTASYQGVSRHGGVLALAGDDHNARSTVTAQQSETLFAYMGIPVLNPATVQDYLDFGLAGWALSRFASSWVGMICLNDTADSGATVDVDSLRPRLIVPSGIAVVPPLGTPRPPGVEGAAQLEREIRTLRHPAAQAFVRANRLDFAALPSTRPGPARRGLGIVTSGKAYLDVMDALARLRLTPERAAELGVSVYKVAMPWPLEPEGVLEFVDGLDEVLVVEAKYPLIEDQINRLVRRLPSERRPDVVGKTDTTGALLIPEVGGLDADIVAKALLSRLGRLTDDADLIASLRPRTSLTLLNKVETAKPKEPNLPVRSPGFCSGCPHNTSTQVPEGQLAIGGTGCHAMAIGVPDEHRTTHMFTHMGGEGALWIGMAPFSDRSHTFQNMGDGTYSHSGYLAIRAAIAADVNITFKILLNGYISMTGGQPIPGGLTARQVAAQVLAEGARKVVVVTDDKAKARRRRGLPRGVTIHYRDDLLQVEERLAKVAGVTVLIYDQPCAAELRRLRKRKKAVDPDKRVYINAAVCEGCGDCNVQSNCISVEPLDTELGRKRRIDQSSCNKDFSCVSGYCPSFVTLYGAKPTRKGKQIRDGGEAGDPFRSLPTPSIADAATRPYNIVVGGIGGGGVLTIGAILGMAAHLEGKSASVLNESGMAQKNGAVHSHIRISGAPDEQLSARIGERSADLVLAADLVVATGSSTLSRIDPDRTSAVANEEVRPTVGFALNPEIDYSPDAMKALLARYTNDKSSFIDATQLAVSLLGDAIYSNLLLLGYAVQLGQIPVSVGALEQAVRLNNVAVAANQEALQWGRLAAHDMAAVMRRIDGEQTSTSAAPAAVDEDNFEHILSHRRTLLVEFQDDAYAERYIQTVRRIAAVEQERVPGHDEVSIAAARYLYKLMAYKDEYEVARLYTDPAFMQNLRNDFDGSFRYKVNLAPQLLNKRDHAGRAKKWEVPAAIAMPAFRMLAKGKRIRGGPLDLFGRTAHRRAERARIQWYDALLETLAAGLNPANHLLAIQIASVPEQIRGYDTIKDESAVDAEKTAADLLTQFQVAAGSSALVEAHVEH